MKLLLSKPRGFCAGVVRAIDVVKEALTIWGAPIYVKHEIVHNQHVVNELKEKGAIFVEELKEVPEKSILIYSAHGIPPEVRAEAKERNLFEIDATCPLVTKVHSAAKRYAEKGYQIILIGHKNHVEIIGTYGEAPNQTVVVESPDDVKALNFSDSTPIFYLMQTTLSLDDVNPIVSSIKEKYPKAITLPSSSICFATTNRQQALMSISKEAQLVLVVGDPTSSNSNRLREIASYRNIPAYLIHQAEEIQKDWLNNVDVIAMTAGASTPDSIVQECISQLQKWGVTEVDERTHIKEDVFFDLPKEIKNAQSHV